MDQAIHVDCGAAVGDVRGQFGDGVLQLLDVLLADGRDGVNVRGGSCGGKWGGLHVLSTC